VRSFIEPDLFKNNVLFNNTTPIYLINLPWKLGLDLKLHYFSNFLRRIKKMSIFSSVNFTEGNIVLKERTHSINNKTKLYIL